MMQAKEPQQVHCRAPSEARSWAVRRVPQPVLLQALLKAAQGGAAGTARGITSGAAAGGQ